MLAGRERCVDYEAGLWWDRFKAFAGKIHLKIEEEVFFGVSMSMFLLYVFLFCRFLLFRLRIWRVVG